MSRLTGGDKKTNTVPETPVISSNNSTGTGYHKTKMVHFV